MIGIVLDTCELIDGLYNPAERPNSRLILEHIARGDVQLLISDPIRAEYLRLLLAHAVLAGLAPSDTRPVAMLFSRLLGASRSVRAKRVFTECADSDDNKLFDCAICGKALCIISADHHVLSLAPVMRPHGIGVVSPYDAHRTYRELATL